MAWNVRLTIALLSISICILAVSFSFMSYYGQVFEASPLMNTNMKFWTIDPTNNVTTPYLWQVDIIKGPHDNVSIYQTEIDNRQSLGLNLSRSNENNTGVWTTVHVRQDLHGLALDTLFRSQISLWVYPTFEYHNDPNFKDPHNTFGVEINDGTNLLWYVFADNQSQVFQLPHHRIVLMQTPLKTWSLRELDIGRQFQEAGWKEPQSLSFILILGTTWVDPGNWWGYFSGLNVNVSARLTQSLSETQRAGIMIADGLVIMGIVVIAVILQRHKTRTHPVGKKGEGR